MATNEEFNNLVKKAIFYMNINQEELAARLGISPSYLSGIKRDKKQASDILLRRITELLSEYEASPGGGEVTESAAEPTDTKERLLKFLTYKRIGQFKFEQSIGMSRGWANKVGDYIRESNLQKIREVYPELNIIWLKTGLGNMLVDAPSDGAQGSEDQAAQTVRLIPLAAQGGSLNDFVVSIKENECEKIISPIRGAEFAMAVSGDSMAPEFPNGSQILIKRINERAFIDWGKCYVLDTCNGTVIKILVPSEREGYIKCLSINKDPIYAPFEVAWEDIYGVFRVLLCMSVK